MSRFCPVWALSNEIPGFEGEPFLGRWDKWAWPEDEGLGAPSSEQKALVHCSGSSAVTPIPSALHLRFLAQSEHVKANHVSEMIHFEDSEAVRYEWMHFTVSLAGPDIISLTSLHSYYLQTLTGNAWVARGQVREYIKPQASGTARINAGLQAGPGPSQLAGCGLGDSLQNNLCLLYLQVAQQKDNLDLATSAIMLLLCLMFVNKSI